MGSDHRSGESSTRVRATPTWISALKDLGRRPSFSYAALVALQAKVMWGIWSYRDLTSGDEATFYCQAYLWLTRSMVDIAWSPLYAAFFGTVMRLTTTDPYAATTLHRILIVLLLDVLVLALLRRLLPPGIAWLVAAWWAVLPIVFDATFTVHLFAVIPILVAWLLLGLGWNPWTRGGALAVFLAATFLVRNEYMVATAVLALSWLIWEWRARPRCPPEARTRGTVYALAYGLPILLVGLLVGLVYTRAVYRFPALHYRLNDKHVLNMCQVYAFGYQQRHPEWRKDPWVQCTVLMQETFGQERPTLSQMLRANPKAVAEHFLWNLRLTPAGLQLLLFNSAHSTINPDYAPSQQLGSPRPLIPSIGLGLILLAGLYRLFRERRYWWRAWLRRRAGAWWAMFSVLPVGVAVLLSQRPRPAYLFVQGIVLMAVAGMCLFMVVRPWRRLQCGPVLLPLTMVTLVLLAPNRYRGSYRPGERPLLALYERLAPFAEVFRRPATRFLVSERIMELNGYLVRDFLRDPALNFDYSILSEALGSAPLPGVLADHGVTLLYVNENLWRRLETDGLQRPFITSPESAGWRVVGMGGLEGDRWMLLDKTKGDQGPALPTPGGQGL
ncbi:MAG TPA: hypothetical protein VN375_21835 [Vicinamibacteria bacterium]|nr:hypothetical protein [Vicinamibacteria bacterium]